MALTRIAHVEQPGRRGTRITQARSNSVQGSSPQRSSRHIVSGWTCPLAGLVASDARRSPDSSALAARQSPLSADPCGEPGRARAGEETTRERGGLSAWGPRCGTGLVLLVPQNLRGLVRLAYWTLDHPPRASRPLPPEPPRTDAHEHARQRERR